MLDPVEPDLAPAAPELPVVSVLLVDDRAENLYALEASLEPLGQRLVRATSGDDALREVLAEQFAVILMDIRMPGLDGFETIALIKQREKSRHIPIIFLTAFPEQHTSLRSYSSGAVDFLQKPFDPEALRSKVSVFVRLRQHQLALEAAHAELEARVEARTAELAAANQELEREVAERVAAEQRLVELAHHDGLTGLANRSLLMEHLNRAVARARRRARPSFAVMMMDLDRFKSINDTHGHLAGDRLLIGVAERLGRCLREVDMPARLGGDEFAVLLDSIDDVRQATRTAERIQKELEAPFVLDDHGREVFVTASIGIAMMEHRYDHGTGQELLRDADTAMYRAKEAGRARYQVFDRVMHDDAIAQLGVEAELSAAVDRGELVLHYQPIVRVADRRLAGFEALVRWQHPTRGLIAPGDFIPLAEDTGLIRPIGRWVLGAACRQLAAWTAVDAELTLSVNLSSHQLAEAELVGELAASAREAGADLARLRLEITESAMLGRSDVVVHTLARLRELGVAISLDDFGTGYSCLAYLSELAVGALKIDRSFIARIGETGERPEIMRAIVSLAHSLGIDVIAEGVETAPQLARVEQLACRYVQGFYFARPLTASAADELVQSRACVAPRS